MKNSSTIILPRWFSTLDEYELKHRMMPRDVSTRWNSTYDMLIFSLQYRDALDHITGDRDMKLRLYEMDDDEWTIAKQLCAVLKVGLHFIYDASVNIYLACRYSRMPPIFPRAMVHRTSRLSFLPWIAWMKSWPPVPSILSTLFRFKRLLPWERRHSIATTARLTIPRFIGSL